MSDEPTITLWLFIPTPRVGLSEEEIIAPFIHPMQLTLEEIAFRLNSPEEVTTIYFATKEQAEEYLAYHLAAQEASE